jgi:hypothetical protein
MNPSSSSGWRTAYPFGTVQFLTVFFNPIVKCFFPVARRLPESFSLRARLGIPSLPGFRSTPQVSTSDWASISIIVTPQTPPHPTYSRFSQFRHITAIPFVISNQETPALPIRSLSLPMFRRKLRAFQVITYL